MKNMINTCIDSQILENGWTLMSHISIKVGHSYWSSDEYCCTIYGGKLR